MRLRLWSFAVMRFFWRPAERNYQRLWPIGQKESVKLLLGVEILMCIEAVSS